MLLVKTELVALHARMVQEMTRITVSVPLDTTSKELNALIVPTACVTTALIIAVKSAWRTLRKTYQDAANARKGILRTTMHEFHVHICVRVAIPRGVLSVNGTLDQT